MPILTFANNVTATGKPTAELFDTYKSIMNAEVDQILLEESDWVPESNFTV